MSQAAEHQVPPGEKQCITVPNIKFFKM